jgi:hypothetical protein
LKAGRSETVTDVRVFLGTAGTLRIWIKDFTLIAHPLVELMKKGVEWKWTKVERSAMEELKAAVLASEAICPINYKSPNEVILAVDSSQIACGYILSQLNNSNQQQPACYGSITFNEHKVKYSQAKIELHGLFRSIHAVKLWIIGVQNLTVEVDVKYIKGMLNNPDMHLNAMINQWIAAILLFPFKLVHVPAAKHQGPDGLSRRRPTVDEGDNLGDAEEWVEEALSCGLWVARSIKCGEGKVMTLRTSKYPVLWVFAAKSGVTELEKGIVRSKVEMKAVSEKDNDLRKVKMLVEGVGVSKEVLSAVEREVLVRRVIKEYFVAGGRLWRQVWRGRHQLVVFDEKERLAILEEMHDSYAH